MVGALFAGFPERLRKRTDCVLAVVVTMVLATLLGGLGPLWPALAVIGFAVWAGLWPEARIATPDPIVRQSADVPAKAPVIDEAFLLPLLEGLPDAALLLDARGMVLAANAASHAISPVTTGRPLSYWTRSPELLGAAERAYATGLQQRCHVRLFTPVERSLDLLVTPAGRSERDTARAMLVTCRDLTEQEQLSRMRVEFVANASHELRTPLASLRGFVETLQGAAKDDPAAQARFLAIMQSQAERMSRLIEDLLSLSRIEMREHVAPDASVDLAAIATDAVATLKPQAEKAGISLEASLAGGPAVVIADRDELGQVAQNLIQNAIKYGRRGGKVAVAIKREAGALVLEVADDGIGIAPEHLPRLTERFYRVSAKDSKDRGGTGLGLAIVKHIVNRHRGELRIASVPGEGSTFEVVLPVAPSAG